MELDYFEHVTGIIYTQKAAFSGSLLSVRL